MDSVIYVYACGVCDRAFLIARLLEEASEPCPACHVVGEVALRGMIAFAPADSP